MSGETFLSHDESFSSKQLADELRSISDAELARGIVRPESSPIKQIERGEFDYDNENSPNYVEEGRSAEMLQAVTNQYFKEQPRTARLVKYRYDQLAARDPELQAEEPRATIAIPIAIHNENAATLQATLYEIAKQNGVNQDELLLYANMPSTLSEADKANAQAKLDAVIAQARQDNPQLTIRSITVEYDEDKLSIGRVRHDYMDLVAWDAARRGFGIDHPVIMLDADTKQMTKTAFEELADTLTAPDSDIIVAHTETHHLFDNNARGSETEMPDARKLAVLQEIRRRQYLRQESRAKAEDLGQDIGEVYNQGHYDEEWGMAVALGPYLLVGGYDEHSTLDESRFLMQRLYDEDGSLYDVMHHAKTEISAGKLFNGAYYLVGTKIRGSGRRPEQRLREWVTGGVDDSQYANMVEKHITSGHQYQDFSHTDALRTDDTSEPTFKNPDHAKRIVGSVLKPESVPRLEGEPEPMPNPTSLLKRLNLPDPDDEESGSRDSHKG